MLKLNLLLNEIEDALIQENFKKIKKFVEETTFLTSMPVLSIRTTKKSVTVAASDEVVIFNSGSALTGTLPPAANMLGKKLYFKNINTGVVTIKANSTELIDAANTKTLPTQYDALTIISDGTNWHIL